MKKQIFILLALLPWLLASNACAEDLTQAEMIAHSEGIPQPEWLTDGDWEQSQHCAAGASLTVSHTEEMGAMYLVFDREYDAFTVTDSSGHREGVQTDGMLHVFVDLQSLFGQPVQRVILEFPAEAELNEIRFLAPGEVPDWVQRWERIPDGQADLMLFSTHGDDEQLFFAGLLPWYGAEQGKRIQVVYFTDHRNMTKSRVHEMLNGLWAVGIRDYPVFGAFADYYTFDREDAYRFYAEAGQSEEVLLSFVVEQLRRYQPQVAVGHDLDGEYGHGMHRMYADLLCKASQCSADETCFPTQVEQYGVWDVPKVYLHLYPNDEIVLDWDIPMDAFDGATAYEVSRDRGFAAHASQQKDFAWYFRGADRAAEIEQYSPCRYGLYRSLVGEDEQKNDFFENLSPREEPPQEQMTLPPETVPPEQSASEINYEPPARQGDDSGWIFIPAVGTVVLTVLTVCLNVPQTKEKF